MVDFKLLFATTGGSVHLTVSVTGTVLPVGTALHTAVKLDRDSQYMWSVCAWLKHVSHVCPAETNPLTPTVSHTIMRKNFRECDRGRSTLFLALRKRGAGGQREMERVTSLHLGLSQRDDWKADVTVWANERGRKKRMSSFIFRVRLEKARADCIDDVYSWGVNDLGWWGCERSSSLPDWVQTVCWHSGLNKQKESCFCHIVITPGTH